MFTFKKQKAKEQRLTRQRAINNLPANMAVFSYHAQRASADIPRERQMDGKTVTPVRRAIPKSAWRQPKILIGLSVVLAAFIYLLSLSQTPRIVIVGDTSSKIFAHDLNRYQQTARALFHSSIVNANKVTVNTDAIIRGLQNAFPEIHTVTITLPVVGRQPIVYIQTATPQLILATQHNGQFVLDSNGKALIPVTNRVALPTGQQALPVVQDNSGLSISVGQTILPKQEVNAITEINNQLRVKQLTVVNWSLPAQASELDVKLSNLPYIVRFNLQSDAREEAGIFLATKTYLDGRHITPSQYVDVRLSGRAYYM